MHQFRRTIAHALLLIAGLALVPSQGRAQQDTTQRMKRYTHNLGYGAALGFLYAGVDQLQNEPSEWGKGWPGYGNRLASNVGEFVIQESVTDLLSFAMHRPLTYTHCPCNGTAHKVEWALQSSVTDVLPNGKRAFAYPRVIGAYAGSFAQAAWLPEGSTSRTQTALVNGTVSLLIGAGINLFYELRSGGGHADAKPAVAER
ncbi:MAG: hypothetical protein ACJ8B6_16115 [Gemmatimonadales bacterium]